MESRIRVLEKELKAFHTAVVYMCKMVPSHLNELKMLEVMVGDKAERKEKRADHQVIADEQNYNARLQREALAEQKAALRKYKKLVPNEPPAEPFIDEEKHPMAAKKPAVKKAKKEKAPLAPGVAEAIFDEAKHDAGPCSSTSVPSSSPPPAAFRDTPPSPERKRKAADSDDEEEAELAGLKTTRMEKRVTRTTSPMMASLSRMVRKRAMKAKRAMIQRLREMLSKRREMKR